MSGEGAPPPPDLDALLDAARFADAQRRSTDAAAAAVLRLLAEADGAMPLNILLGQGAPRDVVAYLAAEDPADKRRRPKIRLGFIADAPVAWLTSQGWAATGRPSGREVAPSADSIAHAAAPAHLARWLTQRSRTLAAEGVTVRCTYGGSCRRWSAEVAARAWAALRTTGDGNGAVGSCTGGNVIPDGLVTVGLPSGPTGEALYARLIGGSADPDDLAETTYALEVESSAKAQSPLRQKVEALEAVCEQLHAARAVLWVVKSRDVARRLRDLGVDDVRRPSQILVPARDVGLDGEDLGTVRRPWWAVGVPPDSAHGLDGTLHSP